MSEASQNRIGNSNNFTDLGIRTDHRKSRRNRATQSCLHCHTNKRKCDRKRPCRRCIQLGMTGLCIYEVEDPDPWYYSLNGLLSCKFSRARAQS
ncbi:hypothetical protein BD410DRAFT_889543 [Rickenella mellea]|uniref:Zn(2)-C6 fungal-type domain-containing protein n=1 Tax=Rickenella mellea TaxID=50990 RepID=A0A4Y7QCF8_9AGAM|nr:hypothetical protein BD410DRAFT_889543 [Rickenella mellea]